MSTYPRAQALDREGLTNGLADVARLQLQVTSIEELRRRSIPPRGGIIVTWQPSDDDPYPEALIVRDEDYRDTLAWLGSYFNGLAPISQWCRVWPQSAIDQLFNYQQVPTVGRALGGWIGLIIAEVSAQSGQSVALREVPGTAALTSASFAAARAVAVWGRKSELRQIAQNHDDLSARLRDGARPLPAMKFLPVWYALSGDYMWSGVESERRSLEPFKDLFEFIAAKSQGQEDTLQGAVNLATDHFDLPVIGECSRGPQSDRVQALDRLAARLMQGPQSPAISALLGFAASLVEPGVAVMPELLKRFTSTMPLAPIWLGAFAGAWSPARVLADNQGLGRMISKSILAEPDLEGRPRCDIAYHELTRWLGTGVTSKLVLRGMAARTVNVELLPGVTAPFAVGRSEVRADGHQGSSQSLQPPATAARPRGYAGGSFTVSTDSLMRAIADLTRRVEQIENSRVPSQPDLLPDVGDQARRSKGAKPRK